MSGPAVLMREIHRLKRFAHELKDQIDRFPKQVEIQKTRVKRQEAAQHDGIDVIKHLKVTMHEKDVSLKSTGAQIKKYEGQLNEIQSKKEYDALLHEIADARKKAQELEDEILALMTDIDERTARLPEYEQNVAKARAEYAKWEKEATARLAEQTAQHTETMTQLKGLEAQVPEKIREQYKRIVASLGHDALAVVKGHACSNCATEITAQNYNVLLQDQFFVCNSCGRILYMPEKANPILAE